MNNLKSKSLNAFLWDFTGNIFSQLLTFITGIILARILSPSEFGLLGMAMVFILYSNMLSDAGLSASIIQNKEISQSSLSTAFYFNVFIGVLLFFTFLVLADFIALFYNEDKLVNIVKVVSINLVFTSMAQVHKAILIKELLFKPIKITEFVATVISAAIGVILAVKGYGVWALIAQVTLKNLIFLVVIFFYSNWRPSLIFSLKDLKYLWGFGSNILGARFINSIIMEMDVLLIGKFYNPATLGFYTRARSFNQFIFKYSSRSLSLVSFPALSKLKDDTTRFESMYLKGLGLVALLSIFLVGLFYTIASPLILLLLTDKWKESIEIFKILCIALLSQPIIAYANSALTAKGRGKEFLQIHYIKAVLFAGCFVSLYFQFYPFLYLYVIAWLIQLLVVFYYVQKEMSASMSSLLKVPLKYCMLMIPIVLLFLLIGQFSNTYIIEVIIKSICISILYFGILFLFKDATLINVLSNLSKARN